MLKSQPEAATRRQALRLGIGGGLALCTPNLLFGGEPEPGLILGDEPLPDFEGPDGAFDFGADVAPQFAPASGGEPLPDFVGRFNNAFSGYEVPDFSLPQRFVDGNVQLAGDPQPVKPHVIQSFQSTQVPGCETTTVQTLEQGRAACHAALASGRFGEARIAVAQQVTGPDGRPQIVFPKDTSGMVAPSAVYHSPNQIGMTTMDHTANQQWAEMLASSGTDGGSILDPVQGYENRLWTPDSQMSEMDEQLMYAGGGLFGGRLRGRNCYSNTQVRCNTQCNQGQRQCGYSYGANCRSGNCNLRPLGTIGGLLRLEFLRPLSSTGGIRHLRFGQRIVARLFPRVAYNKGWINCETAHLLLVKRLFWAIVIGVAAGTAGGGGGAALIFLG